MSKNIRLPPRVQLIDIDSEAGVYPTILRTGDQFHKGNDQILFDDRNTIIFSSSVIVNMPSTVQTGSAALIDGSILFVTSSLFVTGNVIKGIADSFKNIKTEASDFRKFDDSSLKSRYSELCLDPFCSTGSAIEDVGEGFKSPIYSKALIEIDISPVVDGVAAIRNGGVTGSNLGTPGRDASTVPGNWVLNGTDNYPMMYFNFSGSRWEGVGQGFATSITGTQGLLYRNQPTLAVELNAKNQMYGFSPSYAITASVEGRQAAIPFSNFGFPLHPKFHATASQLLDMSQYISHPFVLEKIVYEFSASYRLGSIAVSPNRFNVTGNVEYTDYPAHTATYDPGTTTFTDQSRSVGDVSDATAEDFGTGNWGTPISTFFILNQRRPQYITSSIQQIMLADHDQQYGTEANFISAGYTYPWPSRSLDIMIPSATILSKNGPYVTVDTVRDIVTFAQVSPALMEDGAEEMEPSNQILLNRDLNLQIGQAVIYAGDATTPLWGGEFVMSATVKSPVVNENISYIYMGCNDGPAIIYTANKPGGRQGTFLPTGRDLVSSVVGHQPTTPIVLDDNGFKSTIHPNVDNYKNNPYILLPEDKLIMGWQVPIGKRMFAEGRIPNLAGVIEGVASELKIHPGKGRLLLIGSLIKENKEKLGSLNQSLTTACIHEDISAPDVLDQFITEPRGQYSGSYFTEFITGSSSEQFSNGLATGSRDRQVLASSLSDGDVSRLFPAIGQFSSTYSRTTRGAEHRAMLPGFFRGITLITDNERYYDTLLPRIDTIVTINGFNATYTHTVDNLNYILFGLDKYYSNTSAGVPAVIGSGGTVYSDFVADNTWDRAFPFEPKYSGIQREVNAIVKVESTLSSSAVAIGSVSKRVSIARAGNWTESAGTLPFIYYDGSARDALLHIYGIGTLASGTMTGVPTYTYLDNTAGTVRAQGAVFRGFKYGILNALPENTKAMFRHDHYGQFRDMLEQRLDSKFYQQSYESSVVEAQRSPTESPIQVKFVAFQSSQLTQPRKTWSSNLSTEATSSVPYFDGAVRNREDPIDTSLLNTFDVDIFTQ